MACKLVTCHESTIAWYQCNKRKKEYIWGAITVQGQAWHPQGVPLHFDPSNEA